MSRFRACVAYDGSDFSGWQSQPNHSAIQDIIESSLFKILKVKTVIHGSGRTDAGVHARGQVFHFDAEWKHGAEKLKKALFTQLPETIQIKSITAIRSDFHARFDAKSKRYIYQIYEGIACPEDIRFYHSTGLNKLKLNLYEMQEAAKHLIGTHDFSAFASSSEAQSLGYVNPVKTIFSIHIQKKGAKIKIAFHGSSFLYKMVRSLTGALISVGYGKLSSDEIQSILDSKTRTEVIKTAPARGLFLDKVFYD